MYKINLREVLAFLLVVSVVFLSLFYKLQPPPPASFSWSWRRGRTIPTFYPTLPFLEDSPGRTSKFPLFLFQVGVAVPFSLFNRQNCLGAAMDEASRHHCLCERHKAQCGLLVESVEKYSVHD